MAQAAEFCREDKSGPTPADREKDSTSPSRSLDLSPLRRATAAAGMTLDDVEGWVSILAAQCNASGGGVLTSRDAVHDVLQLARAAMKRSLRNPDRAALLCEKLLLACLSQKQRQLRQRQQQQQQQQLQQQQLQDVAALHYPPVDLYNLVIMSWGSMKCLEGAQRAQQVFDLLQQSYDGFSQVPANVEGDDDDSVTTTHPTAAADAERPPRPDRRTYKSLIRAWAVSRSSVGPAKAREWLQRVEDLSGVSDLLQNANELDSSNRDESSSDIDQDGSELAASPEKPARAKDRLQPPDRAMYNAVLSGYAYAGSSLAATTRDQQQQPTALQHMLAIVDRMDRLHNITQSREYRLDRFSYHALLRAYSKHVRSTRPCTDDIRNVARKIEEFLRRMVRSQDELAASNASVEQGEEHYHDNDTADAAKDVPWSWAVGVLVEALAKSRDPRDVHLAVDYLRVLAGRASPHPGMVAGPRQQRAPSSSSRGCHHDQQQYDTQRTALRAFANNDVEDYPSQESIWKVIQALERLDSDSKRGERTPTTISSERIRDTIDELVRIAIEAPYPRIFFVNQAAEFWIQTGWTYAPDLVEQLMASAWERSRRAASLKPTGQTFAIAMRAWLRCAERDESPHRCELLFQQMNRLHQETSDRYYRPRDEHLRYVINCWLNRCHDGMRYHGLAGHLYPAEHIEAHLQWHVQLGSSASTSDSFDTTAQDWVKNAAGHYSMAIRAWSKQVVDEPDSVDVTDRAVRLLDELERTTDRIPAFPCNWALEIFSQPQAALEMRKKAYDAAIATFRRGERNARTYVLLLKVLRQQVPALDQDHRDVIEGLVKACCSSGMLTQDLIWRAVELLNAESLQRLFGLSYQYASLIVQMRDADLDLDTMSWKGVPPSALLVRNLPQEWSCSIDRQRRAPVSGQRKSNQY
jgi:hypothetical protein